MKAALVVMTIMGCDDSATQCHYIETVETSWQSVELCDAQAERQMDRHQNQNYPVIVAVCETAANRVTAETVETGPQDTAETAADAPVATEHDRNLAMRALDVVRSVVPDRTTMKAIVTTPVRYAEDSYSWVVKRFVD